MHALTWLGLAMLVQAGQTGIFWKSWAGSSEGTSSNDRNAQQHIESNPIRDTENGGHSSSQRHSDEDNPSLIDTRKPPYAPQDRPIPWTPETTNLRGMHEGQKLLLWQHTRGQPEPSAWTEARNVYQGLVKHAEFDYMPGTRYETAADWLKLKNLASAVKLERLEPKMFRNRVRHAVDEILPWDSDRGRFSLNVDKFIDLCAEKYEKVLHLQEMKPDDLSVNVGDIDVLSRVEKMFMKWTHSWERGLYSIFSRDSLDRMAQTIRARNVLYRRYDIDWEHAWRPSNNPKDAIDLFHEYVEVKLKERKAQVDLEHRQRLRRLRYDPDYQAAEARAKEMDNTMRWEKRKQAISLQHERIAEEFDSESEAEKLYLKRRPRPLV